MLDRAHAIYLPNRTPVWCGKLHNYIDTLTTRRLIVSERYKDMPGYPTPGVHLLMHVLAYADCHELAKIENDSERYVQSLMFIRDDLERIFDPVTTGIIRHELFIATSTEKCTEIVIPVRCSDYRKDLPFDKGWSAWEKVRPLRLVETDSRELTFHTYQDKIKFRKSPPTRAIFTIDVIALVLQYVNFLATRAPDDEIIPVNEYIHKYVLNDGLLKDLQDLWFRNRYLFLLKYPLAKAMSRQVIQESLKGGIYGFIGSQYAAGMEEVFGLIVRCQQGSISPGTLLSSLPLSDMYVPEYVKMLGTTTQVADLRQADWVEWLKDRSWLEMSYHAHLLAKGNGRLDYRNFMVNFRRDFDLLIKTRFWSNVYNHKLRKFIEDDVMSKKVWLDE